MTGVVSDSSGALLPGAKVTALDTQTGVSTETTSGLGGVYVFTNLRPSIYGLQPRPIISKSWCAAV
jgi:hypothetical protein